MYLKNSRLLIATAFIVATSVHFCFAQWEDSVLDPIAETGIHEQSYSQCLESDPSGNLHAVHERWTGFGLHTLVYSIKTPGETWQEVTILADSGSGGFQPCVAFSELQNIPYFAYVDDEELYIKFQGDVTWFETQVSPDSQDVLSPTIAIDQLGYIHLAWIFEDGDDNYLIGYAYGDGLDWEIDFVDYDLGPFGGGANPRIVIDNQGIASILFRGGDFPDYRIQDAVRTGEDFSVSPVFSSNTADYTVSVVADDSGYLHAVVSGNDGFGFPGRVQYVYRHPEFGWSFSNIVSDPYSATDGVIALDSGNNPYVVWAEVSGNFYTGNLYFTSPIEFGGWTSQLLIGDDYMTPNFVITPDNVGHALITSGPNTGDDDVFSYSSSSPLFSGPHLVLIPDSINFGQVLVGETETVTVSLTNTGTATLNIISNSITENFSTNLFGDHQLEPFDTITFEVSFHPSDSAFYSGWLTFESDAPSSPDSVPLSGIGFEEPSSVNNNSSLPTAFQLHQNYPNPFNLSTEISFELPVESVVRLTVYNVIGREVAVLANKSMTAGNHRLEWNAASQPAGVYLMELVAGDFREVRKAILLK